MQNFVPIQPKTSNILPKFCEKLATTLRVRRAAAPIRRWSPSLPGLAGFGGSFFAFAWASWSVRVSKISKIGKILQIFSGLVLGCIKTKFCKKICVRQHFSSSTRFASFCTAAISKFSQKIGLKKQQFSRNFSKKIANVAKFAEFCQISKVSA